MGVDQHQVDSSTRPNIRSKRDLTNLCEVEDIETGTVLRSTFAYIDDQDTAWFGQAANTRKYDLIVATRSGRKDLSAETHIYPSCVGDRSRTSLYQTA